VNFNNILILIFVIGILERFISTFGKGEKPGLVKYKWSTDLLICTYLFCIIFVLFKFVRGGKNLNIFIIFVGIFVEIAGILLRKSSIGSLGEYWSRHIKIIPGQILVKTGPFKWVRQPYYIAVILELIGWALFLNTYLVIWFVLLLHLPILLLRIFLEERVLLTIFGAEYQRYRSEVNLFFPKLGYIFHKGTQ